MAAVKTQETESKSHNMKSNNESPGLVVAFGGPKASHKQDCVPLSALAMPDEGEQMTPPEPGDKVSYTVEGKVERIEGDRAYITRESVNGKPCGEEADENEKGEDEEAEPGEDKDLADLKQMAGGMSL